MRVLTTFALAFAACGGGDIKNDVNSTEVDDCSACGTNQICVMVYSAETATTCEPIPDACEGEASCFDDECALAMLESCPEDYLSTGCSDTLPQTVISCNP